IRVELDLHVRGEASIPEELKELVLVLVDRIAAHVDEQEAHTAVDEAPILPRETFRRRIVALEDGCFGGLLFERGGLLAAMEEPTLPAIPIEVTKRLAQLMARGRERISFDIGQANDTLIGERSRVR